MSQKLNDLLILLCRTISSRTLYFDKHPKVTVLVSDFTTQLNEFCREKNTDKLFIGIIDGTIVFEGRNLVGPSIVGRQLINFAEKLHCGGFSFAQQTTQEELRMFLNLTIALKHPAANLSEARELLKSKNINNIELAHHYLDPSGPMSKDQQSLWEGQDSGNFLHSPTLIYQALFDAVTQAHRDVASGNDIDTDNIRSVSEYMLHFIQTGFSDMMQHVHYPDYDSYTLGHSVRVASLAVYLANSFDWNEELLLSITTAGLLHDIGKSTIPDEILFKPGRLTDEEFSIIMAHPQVGAEILMAQKDASPLEIAVAWGHHIRHDGSGYPKSPKWAVKHPITSLLQICDVFEALTAQRPYKPPLSPQMSYSIMLKDKGGFDPALLASFISALGLYPPGNIVRMSDGTKGTVVEVGSKIDRPTVRITHDQEGLQTSTTDKYLINLAAGEHNNLFIEELLLIGMES